MYAQYSNLRVFSFFFFLFETYKYRMYAIPGMLQLLPSRIWWMRAWCWLVRIGLNLRRPELAQATDLPRMAVSL
jgi:hypothetical protein